MVWEVNWVSNGTVGWIRVKREQIVKLAVQFLLVSADLDQSAPHPTIEVIYY